MRENRDGSKCEPSSDWVRPEGVAGGMWQSVECPERKNVKLLGAVILLCSIGVLYLCSEYPQVKYIIDKYAFWPCIMIGGIYLIMAIQAQCIQEWYNHHPWEPGCGHPAGLTPKDAYRR